MATNTQLLGRLVTMKGEFQKDYLNEQWRKFWTNETGNLTNDVGTIEAVFYDKDSRSSNGYTVLVRNHLGETQEFPLSILKLYEK